MGESPVTVGGLFLETTKDEYGLLESGRIRKFQGDFIRALNNDFDIICLSAPTASGKTLCFEYVFKRGKKVLLIYPTNALIEDQYKALSRRWCVKKLRAKDLEGKGRERTSELQATIEKYDIVLTNPDIINAIANKLYVNPSQDLLRFFEKFQYIIYDEFHFYEEFELSGILLQIVLFLNMRYSKVILSSATPSKEFIKNLRTVEMIDTRNPPKIGFIEAKGQDKKTSVNDHHIKYDVEVYFHDGLIYEDNLEDVIEELRKYRKAIRDNRIKGAIIFNSVKDANSFYNRVFEEFGGYIEIDTGYETKASIKIEEKPILITTAKGEVGLNLDIDFLFMEEGFFYNSFIQRFGRIGRHKPGKCYIFTKKKVSLDDKIAYYDFLGYFSNLMKDYVLNREIIDTLFDLRCYFVVREFGKHREKLNIVFKGSKFKKFNKFFTILDKQMEELRGFMGDTLYYRAIKTYLDSLLRSLKGLRGDTLQKSILYRRGEQYVDTQYDLMHVLNWYNVGIIEENNEIKFQQVTRSEEPLIWSLIYDFCHEKTKEFDYWRFEEQMYNFLESQWNVLQKSFILSDNDDKFLDYQFRKILGDLYKLKYFRRILAPHKIVLKNGREINVGDIRMIKPTQEGRDANII